VTSLPFRAPVVIALGPEGGIEPDELEQVTAAGFRLASLGPTTLRFETAGVVALGVARAALTDTPEEP
jgi:16S rRNA (uracil1498-N3)-methyltransferase